MLPGDYNVKLNQKGIAQFTSVDHDEVVITYWIAAEQNSTYNG